MSMVIRRMGPLSFTRCEDLVKDRLRAKVIGPNTQVCRYCDDYVVYFHGSVIIEFRSDGAVLLFTGGYRSVTTKQRLSALSPVHVHQTKGEWYVGHQKFYEGMNVGKPRTEREALEKGMREGDEVAARMLQDMEQGI